MLWAIITLDSYYYSKGISLDMVQKMILLGGHIDHFLFPKQVDLAVEVLVEVLSLIQVTSFFSMVCLLARYCYSLIFHCTFILTSDAV